MRDRNGGPTVDTIRHLRGLGKSDAWIGRRYGVSRQAVTRKAEDYGLTHSIHRMAKDSAPFPVPDKWNKASPAQRLRAHRRFVLFPDSHGLPEGDLKRLRNFYNKLRDKGLIVEFDPTIPPDPGVSSQGGFAYREREVRDRNLVLRLNDYTYTEEWYPGSSFYEVWSFPLEYP